MTTPADAERKRTENTIADAELESEMRQARDAPTPILSPDEAIIFQKGDFLTYKVKNARITSSFYQKQKNAK